jgi:hypothetical protein
VFPMTVSGEGMDATYLSKAGNSRVIGDDTSAVRFASRTHAPYPLVPQRVAVETWTVRGTNGKNM